MRKILFLILKNILLFLIKVGIIKRAVKQVYVVHAKVFLDGKTIIKEFPTDTISTSARAAKKHIGSKITFTSGTTAIGGAWHGRYREFYIQLYIRYEGHIIHSFAVPIMAKTRREAKFDITKRLSFKLGAVAKDKDLRKHA